MNFLIYVDGFKYINPTDCVINAKMGEPHNMLITFEDGIELFFNNVRCWYLSEKIVWALSEDLY